jgi:hypothetical protein
MVNYHHNKIWVELDHINNQQHNQYNNHKDQHRNQIKRNHF